VFAFTVIPENLICTMDVNRYAGLKITTTNQLNSVDYVLVNQNTYTKALLFLSNFMAGTSLFFNLIETLDCTTKDLKASLLKTIKELTTQIDNLNDVCTKNSIPNIVSEGLKESLIFHIFLMAFPNILEYNLCQRNQRKKKVSYLQGTTALERYLSTESMYGSLPWPLQDVLSMILKTHTTEESVDIIYKAVGMYHDYLRDCFLTFITLNKDYRELVESSKAGKCSDYVLDAMKPIGHIDQESFRNQFFHGGYIGINMMSCQKQFGMFLQKQITTKYKNISLLGKRPPEYRLFDEILKQYKAEPTKLFKIVQSGGNEYTGLSGMFQQKEYTDILNKKLPFSEHIQELAKYFETIFKFSRIL
jgi:hypothetical protein